VPARAAPKLRQRFRGHGEACARCPWVTCDFVPPTLVPGTPLLLVGEAPGYWEARQGEPFTGESGIKLNEMLRAAGLSRDDVSLSNVIKCWGNDEKSTPEILGRCTQAYLKQEIAFLAGRGLKLIIAMGEPALRALTGLSGITGNRGKVLYYADNPELRVLPTFNPAFVLRRPRIQPVVESDLMLARQLLAEEINKVEVTYEPLETLDQVEAFFERIRGVTDVVVDLETTGLDWQREQIRCIGVNHGRGNDQNAVIAVDFFRRDGTEARLKPLVRAWLESRRHRFIGQNRKFDCHFLRVWCGAEDLLMDWDDTYVMSYLLNEDTTRGLKSLEALASIYCGLEANYKEKFLRDGLKVKLKKQADFWRVVSSEVLHLYCAADVWVTRRVRDALLDRLRLQPARLELYYGHYLPLQSAVIEAERVGFYIDRGRAERVNARLSKACERLAARWRDVDSPSGLIICVARVDVCYHSGVVAEDWSTVSRS
jgi:uracil-DNA glycosylase family 4